MHYKPSCEYEITSLAHANSIPNNLDTTYSHELTFEGFQNKWCGEMLAESSIMDPWNNTYTMEQETIANQPNTFLVQQDDNFINGDYTATVSWFEMSPSQAGEKFESSISFEIVDADNWCEPSLKFDFFWAVDEKTETWDFVEIISHNYNFNYAVICESPVFKVVFDDSEQEDVLPQPQ